MFSNPITLQSRTGSFLDPGHPHRQTAGATADAAARGKGRHRIATMDSRHGLPIAPNLLGRDFNVATPNSMWVGDNLRGAHLEGYVLLIALALIVQAILTLFTLSRSRELRKSA